MFISTTTTYSWVEEATADPEEYPHIHHQTEAKNETDVEQNTRVWRLRNAVILLASSRLVSVDSCCVGDLCSAKGKEQEHEGAAELCGGSDELIAPFVAYVPVLLWLFGADCDVAVAAFMVLVVVVLGLRRGVVCLLFVQREEVLDAHDGGLSRWNTRMLGGLWYPYTTETCKSQCVRPDKMRSAGWEVEIGSRYIRT
jgi:hypothetical protein